MSKQNVSVIFAILLIFTLLGCSSSSQSPKQPTNQPDSNATVATVNGEPIAYAEFQQMMMPLRAGIYQYFKEKHGVNDNPDFWTSSYGGENPLKMLRERALKSAVKNKAVQLYAKELGVATDVTFKQFLKDYVDENARRKAAAARKEPVYGPIEYSVRDFYQYQLGNLQITSRDALAKTMTRTEAELKQLYETNKSAYKSEGSVTIKKVMVPFTEKGTSKQDANSKLLQMKALITKGDSFESAAQASGLKVSEQTMDERSGKSDTVEAPLVRKVAFTLSAGQVSDVVEEQSASYLIQATAKSDPTFRTFDEVRGQMEQKLNQEQYDAKIESLVQRADVVIQHDIYDQAVPQ